MKANNENDMLGTNGSSTVQSLEKIPALLRERRWVETSRDARLFIVFFFSSLGTMATWLLIVNRSVSNLYSV